MSSHARRLRPRSIGPRTPTVTRICHSSTRLGIPSSSTPIGELRRIAEDRGWPMLEFSELGLPVRAAASPRAAGDPARARRRGRRVGQPVGVLPEERIARPGVLRGGHRDPRGLIFSTPRGAASSGTGSRGWPWLETLPELEPGARAGAPGDAEPGFERWDGARRGRLSRARRRRAIVRSRIRRRTRVSSSAADVPDRRARRSRAAARRGRARRLC